VSNAAQNDAQKPGTAGSPPAPGLPSRETLDLLDNRFPERSVDTAGGTLCYREAGTSSADGTAIVLLHGIGSGAGSWLRAAVALSDTTRVIAWDAPGYGASTPLSPAAPVAADYAAQVHALLQALKVDRCILAGHSLGAIMASCYAHGLGKDIVKSLVLLSPARGYGNPAMAERQPVVRSERLRALDELGIEQMALKRANKMLSPAQEPEALAWVRWNMERLNLAGYRQAVELLCGDDIGRYTGLPAGLPVQVHSGDEDSVTPPASCRAIADQFGAPYAGIARSGHACHIERPEAVAAILGQAFADLQARP
jgi:pimeloyl-ACP methyl ester carboxylesterase